MKVSESEFKSLGSSIDHQHNYPGGGIEEYSVPPDNLHQIYSQDVGTYFCRGCGLTLPIAFRGQFHRDCLKADKRRRMRAHRSVQQRALEKKMARLPCPHCGIKYADGNKLKTCPGEASQGP